MKACELRHGRLIHWGDATWRITATVHSASGVTLYVVRPEIPDSGSQIGPLGSNTDVETEPYCPMCGQDLPS